MANKKINNNDFKFIDLGLPSGTLWATANVGASKPSDYGLYFQWGDVQGYTAEQVGKDKQFSRDDYKFGDYPNFTKYANAGEALNLEDDAANVHMGGDWHMPRPEQIKELIDNTTSNWITQDGVNGRLFTSKKNGKSIFIPAAGYAWNGSVGNVGYGADVWSSTLYTYSINYGQGLNFGSSSVYLYAYYRCLGFSVRGVLG